MRILQLHNICQFKVGAEAILENECQLLLDPNNIVDKFFFDNDTIRSTSYKLKAGINVIIDNIK